MCWCGQIGCNGDHSDGEVLAKTTAMKEHALETTMDRARTTIVEVPSRNAGTAGSFMPRIRNAGAVLFSPSWAPFYFCRPEFAAAPPNAPDEVKALANVCPGRQTEIPLLPDRLYVVAVDLIEKTGGPSLIDRVAPAECGPLKSAGRRLCSSNFIRLDAQHAN
jgi:hypothetical protein